MSPLVIWVIEPRYGNMLRYCPAASSAAVLGVHVPAGSPPPAAAEPMQIWPLVKPASAAFSFAADICAAVHGVFHPVPSGGWFRSIWACSLAPWLPTYATSRVNLAVMARWMSRFHWTE